MTIRIGGLGLLAVLLLVSGCAYQTPVSQSEDIVELLVTPGEMVLRGATKASTKRFHILFLGFGERNSFLRAEQEAIEAVDAELLVNRIRLRHFEGFLLPSLWLQALGLEGATDVPIVGWEIYTVVGTGIRLVPDR